LIKLNVQTTSLNAYFGEIMDTIGDRQKAVMQIFGQNFTRDFTNAELSNELNWPINTVTPRVYELRGEGKANPIERDNPLLVEVRRRKCEATGRTAIAWGLNPDFKTSRFRGLQNL